MTSWHHQRHDAAKAHSPSQLTTRGGCSAIYRYHVSVLLRNGLPHLHIIKRFTNVIEATLNTVEGVHARDNFNRLTFSLKPGKN